MMKPNDAPDVPLRLAALERAHRRWRAGAGVAAALVSIVLVTGMTTRPWAEHLQAERLSIVRDGQVRIELRTDADGAALLTMRDAKGTVRIRAAVPADGSAALDFFDAEGERRYPLLEQLRAETGDYVETRTQEIEEEIRREVGPQIDAARGYLEGLRRAIAGEVETAAATQLEFRIVATPGDEAPPFDLAWERERLEAWLAKHRARVAAEPASISEFHALARERGGPSTDRLRWVPKRVHRTADGRWSWADSRDPESGIVAAFTAAEWNDGKAPPGVEFLVELMPIDFGVEHFTGADLDPSRIAVGRDEVGEPCLNYAMKPARADAYADWSERFLERRCAIIIDGEVVSAPIFMSRIPGRGQICGRFTEAEVEALAASLRAAHDR